MAQFGKRKGDVALVLGLAGGKTVRNAAWDAGVSERTAYRRLDSADFRQQVSQARAEMLVRAVGMLVEASGDAVQVLRRLSKTAKSETVRLGASRSILELGNRLQESVEIETRLCDLERRINEKNASESRGATGRILTPR
jgi:hypothetical protein